MIKQEKNGIVSYQFESFDPNLVNHALYTRIGGVSEGPYQSFNLGGLAETILSTCAKIILDFLKILDGFTPHAMMYGRFMAILSILQMFPDLTVKSISQGMAFLQKIQVLPW